MNGACLTVTQFDPQAEGGWFKVWLANETLERTDLGILLLNSSQTYEISLRFVHHRVGELVVRDYVNLERAMGAHVRFGGHFVQVCTLRP